MNPTPPAAPSSSVDTLESLRRELALYRQELGECHRRMEQMEGIFHHMAEAVFIAEPDGVIIDVNPAATVLVGYEKHELKGLRPWDLVIHATQEEVLEYLRNSESGSPRTVRCRCRCKDGSTKVVALQLARGCFGGRDLVIGTCRDVTAEDRTQASLELALRDMEAIKEQFQMATQSTPGLIWSALPDGSVDFLNQRWLAYTGMTLEQASGWGWSNVVHPEDLKRVTSLWTAAVGTGEPVEMEARLRSEVGLYRWFLIRGVPHRNREGRILKWYGETTDIDERKRAEMWLQGEKRLLEMITSGDELDTVLAALCHLVESLVSGIFCSVLMLDAKEGRLKRGVAPTLPEACSAAVDGLSIGPDAGPCGQAVYWKRTVLVPDILADETGTGGYREVALAHGLRACFSTPILASDGTVLGTFALYRKEPGPPDGQQEAILGQFAHLASIAIERTRSQEQLRRSEASLAWAQHLSATGSFVWNSERAELICSDETYRICGLEPGSPLTGEGMRDLIHPEDLGQFRQILEGSGTEYRFECRLLRRDGGLRQLEVVGSATRDGSGKLIEWAGSVMDVTERMRAAEALRAAEDRRRAAVLEERNRMARDIHDTLAQGFTGVIIQLEAAADARGQNLDEEADQHLRRASELARDSLDEARRSVRALRPRSLEARTLGGAIEDLIQKMTAGTALRATLKVEGPPRTLPEGWDENLLRVGQEVLTNTLRHAAATDFETVLEFAPQGVHFRLRDNGRGFDPGRGHDGFGLVGIRERAMAMGGTATVESMAGEGTQVAIFLPQRQSAESLES